LVEELIRFARAHGVRRVTGMVMAENKAMLSLAHSLGFAVSYDSQQQLMSISRDLDESPAPT
ncbi:MAG TPA: hypothetical protein VIT67_13330, partial [Povalibacter sp.]